MTFSDVAFHGILRINPFGKVFDPEFMKTLFLQRVKIKLVLSQVTTSGIIDFDFTEKCQ